MLLAMSCGCKSLEANERIFLIRCKKETLKPANLSFFIACVLKRRGTNMEYELCKLFVAADAPVFTVQKITPQRALFWGF
jgi:hypothetical protein